MGEQSKIAQAYLSNIRNKERKAIWKVQVGELRDRKSEKNIVLSKSVRLAGDIIGRDSVEGRGEMEEHYEIKKL